MNGYSAVKICNMDESMFKYIMLHSAMILILIHKGKGNVSLEAPPVLLVDKNETVTLNCICTGSNPKLMMWERNKNVLTPASFDKSPCSIDDSNDIQRDRTERYQISCFQNASIYSTQLVIPAEHVNEYEHGSIWSCSTLNGGGQDSNTSVIFLKVPVKSVDFQQNTPNEIFLSQGENISLTCITSAARPHPYINWLIDNNFNFNKDLFIIKTNYSAENVSKSISSTKSSIIIPWQEGGHNQTVTCQTNNSSLVSSEKVNIIHVATGTPIIHGLYNNSPVFEGESRNLTCTFKGGNPSPIIMWSGACVNQSVVSATIKVTFTRDMDRQLCYCFLQIQNTTSSFVAVTATVYYPPSLLSVTASQPFPWVENTTQTLFCSASPGNPKDTNYSWITQEGKTINSNKYVFEILRPSDNHQKYSCLVQNAFTIRQSISLQRTVSLIVQYLPVEELQITRTDVSIYEGDEPEVVNCTQKGGNPLSNVSWDCPFLQSKNVSNATHSISQIIVTAQRGPSERKCTCTESNSRFNHTSKKEITINTYYPPSNVSILVQPNFPWIENTTGLLNCSYDDGIPPMTDYSWYRSSTLLIGETNKTLRIKNVNRSLDTEQFICRVHNKYTYVKNNIVKASTTLKVEFAPYASMKNSKVTTNRGSNVKLQCQIQGNPIPLIYWEFQNKNLSDATGELLHLNNVNISNDGTYICNAVSEIDTLHGRKVFTAQASVYLKVYDIIPPKAPKNISLSFATSGFLNLSWYSSDNGGENQIFIVEIVDLLNNVSNIIEMVEHEKQTEHKTAHFLLLEELKPLTLYRIILFSRNSRGDSYIPPENIITTYLPSEGIQVNPPLLMYILIASSSAGGVLALVFSVKLILCKAKRRKQARVLRSNYERRVESDKAIYMEIT